MITILDRYIAKTIIVATFFTALSFTGIIFLILLLGELKAIGESDYGMMEAMLFVVLRLPGELYQFTPMLILIGCIVGLSMLAAHRELAVIRASGFSIRNILFSVLGAAMVLISVTTFIGEWAAPSLSYRAEVRKENAQNGGQAVVTASGVWYHLENNFIHIDQVVGRQLLEGVTRYQFDENYRLQAAYYAKSLSMHDGQWFLRDMVKTTFLPNQTKSEQVPQAKWDFKLNPGLLNVGLVEPHEMSLPKLAKLAHYLVQNGLQATEYQFEFWQRIFKPLASLIMIFLALPFVLGGVTTATMGWRIMIGILIGFAFYILNAVLGQLCVVYQLPTLLSALLPPLLFAFLWLLLYSRLLRG